MRLLHTLLHTFIVAVVLTILACDEKPTLNEELGYAKCDKLLIIHADDAGLHPDATDATLRAMKEGVVTSASIMVPCADFDRTIRIWKANPDLDFGIHVTLTCEYGKEFPWHPVLSKDEVPSLYSPEGYMWPDPETLIKQGKRDEMIKEVTAQIHKVLNTGMRPSHLDSHQSSYFTDELLFSEILVLAQKFQIPVLPSYTKRHRVPFMPNNLLKLKKDGFVFPNTFSGYTRIPGEQSDSTVRFNTYRSYLMGLDHGVHELITHVAFSTPEMTGILGDLNMNRRAADYHFWTAPETARLIREQGIILISYQQLDSLQRQKWKR